jgi:hypothetical protein
LIVERDQAAGGDQDTVRAVWAAEAILDLGGARRIAEFGRECRFVGVGRPRASDLLHSERLTAVAMVAHKPSARVSSGA